MKPEGADSELQAIALRYLHEGMVKHFRDCEEYRTNQTYIDKVLEYFERELKASSVSAIAAACKSKTNIARFRRACDYLVANHMILRDEQGYKLNPQLVLDRIEDDYERLCKLTDAGQAELQVKMLLRRGENAKKKRL